MTPSESFFYSIGVVSVCVLIGWIVTQTAGCQQARDAGFEKTRQEAMKAAGEGGQSVFILPDRPNW